MDKRYISANELLIDSFRLADQVYTRGFRPHFIVGIWRGGAPVGIAVQEYLQYRGVDTDHIAIRTSSYIGIDQPRKEIKIHGLDYVIENVESDEDLLIVDDVFDSGRSIKAVVQEIRLRARRNAPERIAVACPWYKPQRNVTDIQPDFYLHATDEWLVFPHEIVGLTKEELRVGKGADIADVIAKIDGEVP